MADEHCKKIKLLKLWELLRQETDEQHPMPAGTVCIRLAEEGVTCDRRTLSRDIKVLNDYGFEVMSVFVGHEKAYYLEDRSFSVPELKILIDAVQAASFITEKKSAELIGKIAFLGGSHRAEVLRSNIVSFNTRKHSNESIYYNVGFLEDAIEQNRKISFRYFDLDENGKKVYRRDGGSYITEPVSLVFNEDNYYLVSYSTNHGEPVNYRIDRMDAVELREESVCEETRALRSTIAGYTGQTFKMFDGELENITLRFSDKLIGVIYDRFGEGTKIVRVSEDACTADVAVKISPTFWGWLFQFGQKMQVLSPAYVTDEYIRLLKTAVGQEENTDGKTR